MTTTDVDDALNALEYIGANFPALNKSNPIDEFSLFVGEGHVEVTMHWYYPPDIGTIELANNLVEIDSKMPAGSGSSTQSEIVEEEGADRNRIDVTITYPYNPAQQPP